MILKCPQYPPYVGEETKNFLKETLSSLLKLSFVDVSTFPFFPRSTVNSEKELQGFCLSNNDIPSANLNGREAQHASAMDRNLVTLFFGIDCTCMQKKVERTDAVFEWALPRLRVHKQGGDL